MNCPRCGNEYSAGENFCSSCGSGLKPSTSGYRHASLISRTVAFLIDSLLLVVPLMLVFLFYISDKYGGQLIGPGIVQIIEAESPLFTVGIALTFFIYFSLLEGRFQATLGKKLLRIRIVDKDFSRIGYSKAVVRNAVRLIWDLPVLGFLLLILDVFLIFSRHQRLGDMAAGTYVMRSP